MFEQTVECGSQILEKRLSRRMSVSLEAIPAECERKLGLTLSSER